MCFDIWRIQFSVFVNTCLPFIISQRCPGGGALPPFSMNAWGNNVIKKQSVINFLNVRPHRLKRHMVLASELNLF